MLKHKKQGFTIVELMVTCMVLSAVIMACASLIVASNNTLTDGKADNELRSQTNDAIRYITREIQSAELVYIINNPDEKSLIITPSDPVGHTIKYELVSTPIDGVEGGDDIGELLYNDKIVFKVNFTESSFYKDENSAVVDLRVLKSPLRAPYKYNEVRFQTAPRGGTITYSGGF